MTPPDLPRRFAVSLWGVGWGLLLATAMTAAIVAVRGDTRDRPHPALLRSDYLKPYEVVPWQERYEQSWYVLACVCGAAGAWAAGFTRVPPWLAFAAFLAFVPAATAACRGVFFGKLVTGRMLTCAAILAVPLLGLSGRARSVSDGGQTAEKVPVAHAPGSSQANWLTALLALFLVAIVLALFAPADLATAASECNTELHVGAYLVGPALYYRAPGVVPGLDFESHYGIGHAHAFSLVMGDAGLQNVLERYVLFVLVVTAAYFLTVFLVLADWLRNPWAAFGVALLLVGAAAEGLAYTMPSCWPVRHPFLFVFLFAAVRGVGPSGRSWCLIAGGIAGLSLYWQTDIGLFTLAAGTVFYAANAAFLGGSARRPAEFLVAGVGGFLTLCLVLFGPRVLSLTFAERLLEPLLLYATGFGTVLMTWKPGWAFWFNLAGPGIAIASVGVMLGYRRGEPAPRGVLYATAAGLLGCAMLTKWVNRSLDVLWALNGGLVLAVAAWWAWTAWRTATERLGFPTRLVAGCGLFGLLGLGLWADARASGSHPLLRHTSPLVRIAERLDSYPNVLNGLRREIAPNVKPSPLNAGAVAFLRSHTEETERVTLISSREWEYLAAAARAPRFSWLQLFLVHSPVLLDRCAADLRECDRVFVERGAIDSLNRANPAAHEKLVPILAQGFEVVEESPHWIVYRRTLANPYPGG